MSLRQREQARPSWNSWSATASNALRTQGRIFDMVMVQQSPAHAENLFSAEAFRATADLIEVLRPGGSLVFVLQHGDNQSAASVSRHESSCCSQHFGVFPAARATPPISRVRPDRTTDGDGCSVSNSTARRRRSHTLAPPTRTSSCDWRAIGQAAAQAKSGMPLSGPACAQCQRAIRPACRVTKGDRPPSGYAAFCGAFEYAVPRQDDVVCAAHGDCPAKDEEHREDRQPTKRQISRLAAVLA